MTFLSIKISTAALVLIVAGTGAQAGKDIITANCTGMFDLDIYTFDPAEPMQDVAKIGMSDFSMDEDQIVLLGDFGEYRFDLKVGTLYQDGKDTGIYCTYSGL